MSITNQQLITDALTMVGVMGEGGTLSSTHQTLGLRILNELMDQLLEDEIDLQYFRQGTIGDTTPIPDWSVNGIKSMLAVWIAADTGVPITAEVASRADSGYQTILRRALKNNMREADMSRLHQGVGGLYSRYNINTDA